MDPEFPTKTTWKKPSRIEYIEKGLQAFVKGYENKGITSIAFPALGCGNGELNWEKQVRPLMEKYLEPLPIDIFIYIYDKNALAPEHRNIKSISTWLRSEPESLSFQEVWEDVKKLIDKKTELLSFYEKRRFHLFFSKDKEEEFIRVDWGWKRKYLLRRGFEFLEDNKVRFCLSGGNTAQRRSISGLFTGNICGTSVLPGNTYRKK